MVQSLSIKASWIRFRWTVPNYRSKNKKNFFYDASDFGLEPRIPIINDSIEEKIKSFENHVKSFDPRKKPQQNLLEEGFIKIIDYCEGKV